MKPREGLRVREGAQGMRSTRSTQVRDSQLLPPPPSLMRPHEESLRQSGPVLLSCILGWLLATPNCCHSPPSALGTTPIQHSGRSSSSADGVRGKPGLETANGAGRREELQWEDMEEKPEKGCVALTTIMKSMEEQYYTSSWPFSHHAQSNLSHLKS